MLPATYSIAFLFPRRFQSSSRHLCLPETNSFGRGGEALCKHMLDLSKGKKKRKSWKDLEETRFPAFSIFIIQRKRSRVTSFRFVFVLLRKFELYLFRYHRNNVNNSVRSSLFVYVKLRLVSCIFTRESGVIGRDSILFSSLFPLFRTPCDIVNSVDTVGHRHRHESHLYELIYSFFPFQIIFYSLIIVVDFFHL